MRTKEEAERLAKFELEVLIDRHGMVELLHIFAAVCGRRSSAATNDPNRARYWEYADTALAVLANELEQISIKQANALGDKVQRERDRNAQRL